MSARSKCIFYHSYIRGAGRLRRLTAAAAGRRGRARRGPSRRSPRAGRCAPSARAAAASVEVKPESTCETRGRTGGRAGEWVARADGRMGGRVGGASGRATAARAGGTWVTARVGSSGGGARAVAAAHRLEEKVRGCRCSRLPWCAG